MTENEGNVTSLNLPKDEHSAAVEQIIRNAPGTAKFRKKLYDEYVAVGFTPDQALQLCVK